MIKIIFCSSAEISLPLLKSLHDDKRYKIVGVLTQADKASGRNLQLKANAAKALALDLELDVFDSENLNDPVLIQKIKSLSPDFFLTFAYGKILSEDWLKLPKIAPINIHASILPKYRGASPIQAALLNGEKESGISIIKMIKEMDAGPVYKTIPIKIENKWTAGILQNHIALLAVRHLPDLLTEIAAGQKPFEQNSDLATYCKKIKKNDGFLDFKQSANSILSMYRAYSPWPGLWTLFGGKRLKFLDIELCSEKLNAGEIFCENSLIKIGTKKDSILIKRLQMESKEAMSAKEFLIGQKKFCSSKLPS